MGLIRAISHKFEGQPLKVILSAAFLGLISLSIFILFAVALVVDVGVLGALAIFGGIALFILFFVAVGILATSDL